MMIRNGEAYIVIGCTHGSQTQQSREFYQRIRDDPSLSKLFVQKTLELLTQIGKEKHPFQQPKSMDIRPQSIESSSMVTKTSMHVKNDSVSPSLRTSDTHTSNKPFNSKESPYQSDSVSQTRINDIKKLVKSVWVHFRAYTAQRNHHLADQFNATFPSDSFSVSRLRDVLGNTQFRQSELGAICIEYLRQVSSSSQFWQSQITERQLNNVVQKDVVALRDKLRQLIG